MIFLFAFLKDIVISLLLAVVRSLLLWLGFGPLGPIAGKFALQVLV